MRSRTSIVITRPCQLPCGSADSERVTSVRSMNTGESCHSPLPELLVTTGATPKALIIKVIQHQAEYEGHDYYEWQGSVKPCKTNSNAVCQANNEDHEQ